MRSRGAPIDSVIVGGYFGSYVVVGLVFLIGAALFAVAMTANRLRRRMRTTAPRQQLVDV